MKKICFLFVFLLPFQAHASAFGPSRYTFPLLVAAPLVAGAAAGGVYALLKKYKVFEARERQLRATHRSASVQDRRVTGRALKKVRAKMAGIIIAAVAAGLLGGWALGEFGKVIRRNWCFYNAAKIRAQAKGLSGVSVSRDDEDTLTDLYTQKYGQKSLPADNEKKQLKVYRWALKERVVPEGEVFDSASEDRLKLSIEHLQNKYGESVWPEVKRDRQVQKSFERDRKRYGYFRALLSAWRK